MEDGGATLGIGFEIDPGESFSLIGKLDDAFDSSTARILEDVKRIETATGGMLNLGSTTAQITAFGNAATRELQAAAAAAAKSEKAGEALSRQLDSQIATFGKSREELTAMKVATAALNAEQSGQIELAEKLRAQGQQLADLYAARAAAATADALATRNAAQAYQAFEAAARAGAAAMREVEAGNTDAVATAGKRIEESMRGQAASSGLAKAGYQQLNFQLSDIATQYSSGTKPMQIFAQQSGQLFQALGMIAEGSAKAGKGTETVASAAEDAGVDVEGFGDKAVSVAEKAEGMGGKLGAVAGFMTGPWGAALLIGASVLTPFVAKLFEGNGALDDAVDKLKKDAEASDIARQAKEQFKTTEEGVAAAIRDSTAAYNESAKAEQSAAERANIEAKNNLALELQIRRTTAAKLDSAKADLAAQIGAQRTGGASVGGALGTYVISSQITDLQSKLDEQKGLIAEAERRVQTSRIDLAGEGAARAADPLKRINKLYDDQTRAARDAARAQVAAGGTVTNALVNQLAAIETNRRAAVKAEQDKQSAAKQTADQIGRNITLAQARSIAEGVGGHVTSGLRDHETQQRLYDKYMAYKAGNGPWAALAAKPGTSNHELGQALDIAKGDGMTLKKLVTAYRAAGVSLTEALDEGDHYHVAWKKVGTAARQQSAEITAAARELTEKEVSEAQIKNLYGLADAYKITGGAALIAGAQLKAEGDAIKRNGDVTAAVNRQVQIAIAQRVADAEKSTAGVRQQAAIQEQVNAQVAAGLIPAERANELVRERMQDLPLLEAIEAAQKRGLTSDTARATKALADQRTEQLRLNAAESQSQLNSATSSGNDQLALLREELRLTEATEEVRARGLATFKARQDVAKWTGIEPAQAEAYVKLQGDLAAQTVTNKQVQDAYNDSLSHTATMWSLIADNVNTAASDMSNAMGSVGGAIGGIASTYTSLQAKQAELARDQTASLKNLIKGSQQYQRVQAQYATRGAIVQVKSYGDMAKAAQGFFKQGTAGYRAMETAEKAFRAIELALAIKNAVEKIGLFGATTAAKVASDVAQGASDTARTGVEMANDTAKQGTGAITAVVNAIKDLPFPLNILAGAATIAALAGIGVAVAGGFGGHGSKPVTNTGTGTVYGDSTAQSESLAHAIDALKGVDTLTMRYSAQMLASLKNIEASLGAVTNTLIDVGDIGTSLGIKESKGLFSSKKIVGEGIYSAPQSLSSILAGGFDAQFYADVKKKSLFSSKTKTKYGGDASEIESQFSLILQDFDKAILAAAGPLGLATDAVSQKLNAFVVDIGKIDIKGLTGAEIQTKLGAVFSAEGDRLAQAAIPGLDKFEKAGEGYLETLTRVATVTETVNAMWDLLGRTTVHTGVDASMAIAGVFDSLSDFTEATQTYFQNFYTSEEQAALKATQLSKAFGILGLTMPDTLAGFRALVDAQNLTTTAGEETYATLLKLAPAFYDLKTSMEGAKSAADVLSEREGLISQIWDLTGNTVAIRAAELAKLDPSNRALQQQIYAIQDAKDAADAATQLRDAWKGVGDSILDEINRIRGLTTNTTGDSFASLLSQFNNATASARAGDQKAAQNLPGLSKQLLDAAAAAATSRQELDRVQAQTAASLEATYAAISGLMNASTTATDASSLSTASAASQGTDLSAANDDMVAEIKALRVELAGMRTDNNSGMATIAGGVNRAAKRLDDVTDQASGAAITVAQARP